MSHVEQYESVTNGGDQITDMVEALPIEDRRLFPLPQKEKFQQLLDNNCIDFGSVISEDGGSVEVRVTWFDEESSAVASAHLISMPLNNEGEVPVEVFTQALRVTRSNRHIMTRVQEEVSKVLPLQSPIFCEAETRSNLPAVVESSNGISRNSDLVLNTGSQKINETGQNGVKSFLLDAVKGPTPEQQLILAAYRNIRTASNISEAGRRGIIPEALDEADNLRLFSLLRAGLGEAATGEQILAYQSLLNQIAVRNNEAKVIQRRQALEIDSVQEALKVQKNDTRHYYLLNRIAEVSDVVGRLSRGMGNGIKSVSKSLYPHAAKLGAGVGGAGLASVGGFWLETKGVSSVLGYPPEVTMSIGGFLALVGLYQIGERFYRQDQLRKNGEGTQSPSIESDPRTSGIEPPYNTMADDFNSNGGFIDDHPTIFHPRNAN